MAIFCVSANVELPFELLRRPNYAGFTVVLGSR
jgi:hypothetical protein